jgi:hypothetical protein
MSKSKSELREHVRYNLVTELSGRKEFAGWSMNEIGRFADQVMRGV